MCSKKVIDTETKAIAVAKKLSKKYFNLYKHYWCKDCKGWHTAHAVPRGKMKQLMSRMGMEYTQ